LGALSNSRLANALPSVNSNTVTALDPSGEVPETIVPPVPTAAGAGVPPLTGLLFLAMMFVSTAIAAALVATNTGVTDAAAHAEVIGFGTMIVVSASKTYAIRMAAVFMMSLATIWLKTGLMPRWLVVVSYLVAVALLIASDVSMWLTLAFPIWVLVVSGLILLRSGFINEQRANHD
jgi:hypothetical protein